MKDLFSDFELLHCDELIILFEYQHGPMLPKITKKKKSNFKHSECQTSPPPKISLVLHQTKYIRTTSKIQL